MRTRFFVVLVLVVSASVGLLVYGFTYTRYGASESQGPYDYDVKFGEGTRAKDLGVIVNINLSFAKTWFVGEEKNVDLEVSAEKISSVVQNFSWRVFWIKLYAGGDVRGNGREIVGFGSNFLNASEWSASYLYKHQSIPVGVVNLNYFESVDAAWFDVEMMMEVYHNDTDYSFTFHAPTREIGSIAVLSPLYSSTSLATISTAIVAAIGLTYQLSTKTTSKSDKKLLP